MPSVIDVRALRRRPLYPTELRGLIQKIFNFAGLQDSNDSIFRRRTLYPGEVRGHTAFGFPNAFLLCHAFRVLSSAFAFTRAIAFISRKTGGFFETGLKIRSFYVKI